MKEKKRCGNHSARGAHDGQKYSYYSPKKKLFNILPNKIKKTEESKQGEQLKQLLK